MKKQFDSDSNSFGDEDSSIISDSLDSSSFDSEEDEEVEGEREKEKVEEKLIEEEENEGDDQIGKNEGKEEIEEVEGNKTTEKKNTRKRKGISKPKQIQTENQVTSIDNHPNNYLIAAGEITGLITLLKKKEKLLFF